MGGNGRHTNFRETSLARARWYPDKFAALLSRDPEKESCIATNWMRVTGDRLELLADCAEGQKDAFLEVQAAPSWNKPAFEGFDYGDSCVAREGDRLYISFENGHKLSELAGQRMVFKIRFKGYKLWAVKGDLEIADHRLWEGSV